MDGKIERKLIEDAIQNIDAVKKILDEKIAMQISESLRELLIWGLYMLVAPICVTMLKSHVWWAYLLPLFFIISMARGRSIVPVIIYWAIVEVIFILSIQFNLIWLFYLNFASIPFAFILLKPKRRYRTPRVIRMFRFWILALLGGVMMMFSFVVTKNYAYIPLLWPFLITFSLGLLGSMSNNSLFWLGISGTIFGPLAFIILPIPWKFWVVGVYGLIFVGFYIYYYFKKNMKGIKNGKTGSSDS